MRATGTMSGARRWSDGLLSSVIVAAGLLAVSWLPASGLTRLMVQVWPELSAFSIGVIEWLVTAVICWRVVVALRRMQRTSAPSRCSINVHVFTDEMAPTCVCGCTGDVDGRDGAT